MLLSPRDAVWQARYVIGALALAAFLAPPAAQRAAEPAGASRAMSASALLPPSPIPDSGIALLVTTYNVPSRTAMYESRLRWWLANTTLDLFVVDSAGRWIRALANPLDFQPGAARRATPPRVEESAWDFGDDDND